MIWKNAGVRGTVRVWIASALLLSWPASALTAIGVGFHLTGADHAAPPFAEALALAAHHGHHHDLDMPDHEHAGTRDPGVAPFVPEAGTPIASAAMSAACKAVLWASWGQFPCGTGPPELFYHHCALLL